MPGGRLSDDVELVVSAQHGDVQALAQLLIRHESNMKAVALGILGASPEAQDAVQDASLTALQHIGELRRPDAVGPWLRAIVRNACRMRLRSHTPVPVSDDPALLASVDRLDPATLVERRDTRDWVWHAIDELSPDLRLVVILRYFTDVTTYAEIAPLCGIPIGTVRSRLNHGRTKLHSALMRTAELSHPGSTTAAFARRDAQDVMDSAHHGSFHHELSARWAHGDPPFCNGSSKIYRVSSCGVSFVRQRRRPVRFACAAAASPARRSARRRPRREVTRDRHRRGPAMTSRAARGRCNR